MNRYSLVFTASLLGALTVGAHCAGAAEVPAYIAAAVADSARPDEDKQRDEGRKTGAVRGIRRHQAGRTDRRVFSRRRLLHAGLQQGPWAARATSYALVPERPAGAPADMPDLSLKAKAIAADPNYSNVSVVVAPLSTLVPPAQVDLYWTSQIYHDLHNTPGADVVAFNKTVFDSLKPAASTSSSTMRRPRFGPAR